MDNRLFFLMNMAQHRMFKYTDNQCEAQLGISVTQVAAMLFVAKQEGCLQKELSGALGLNNSAVTGLAGRMEKKGLITRQSCEQDGRASRLYLTETVRKQLPAVFPLLKELNTILTEDFSEAEINTVIRFLNHVSNRFS